MKPNLLCGLHISSAHLPTRWCYRHRDEVVLPSISIAYSDCYTVVDCGAVSGLRAIHCLQDRVLPFVWLVRINIDWGYLNCYFLHDRPLISPWIKSISNELDITIPVMASQLPGPCGVISNRLWRHQQNVDRKSETRGRCVRTVVFIVICGFVMSCKKWNNVCTLMTNCLCTHFSDILTFISFVAEQLGK